MKIAGLGDSITYGYPYGPEHSWLAQVGEKLGVKTINHGVNGELTGEILRRVPNVILDEPNIVIIMGGTNDAYDRLNPQIVESHLKQMIEQLRKSEHVQHVFIGIPPIVVGTGIEQLLDSYRIRLRKLADTEKVAVLDFYEALLPKGLGYLVDSCHPNQAGYKKMAEIAYEALKPIV